MFRFGFAGSMALLILVSVNSCCFGASMARGITHSGPEKFCLTEKPGTNLIVFDRNFKFRNGCGHTLVIYWSNDCQTNTLSFRVYHYKAVVSHGQTFAFEATGCSFRNTDFCISSSQIERDSGCRYSNFLITESRSYHGQPIRLENRRLENRRLENRIRGRQ